MDFQDCVKFANENFKCFVATVDGVQPRVRAISMWYADNKGFYFQTGAEKAFCKQLEKNNKVEVCFFDPETEKMMRVAGDIEFLDDIAVKARCLEERPFLKGLGIEKPGDPQLVVFRIYTGEAHFWTKGLESERLDF